MVKHRYYLLAPSDAVTVAILKLSLIILSFGPTFLIRAPTEELDESKYGKQNSNLSMQSILFMRYVFLFQR